MLVWRNTLMKSLYICGDSFGVPDPEYGDNWVDYLTPMLKKYNVVNLSRVCASNLQIAVQVDRAIKEDADYIIYLMTTSTREEVLHTEKVEKPIYDRFTDITDKQTGTDLTSYSVFSLDHTTILSDEQLLLLKQYHTEFFDMDLTIYKNELIIEGILSRLEQSGISFVYDQGGFENPKFTGTRDRIYFEKYLRHKSAINLWNFVHIKKHRPYYHIEEKSIHKLVANYYFNLINET